MLASDADEAVAWGTRAIELATRLGDSEARVHALNNVGTAEDAQGAAEGHAKVERSLQLALAHGYHARVARAYSTLISVRVTHREYAAAQRYIEPRPRTSRRATLIHGRATCSPGRCACISDAAAAWARLGCPYERALALQHGHEASLREALAVFEQMGASASAVLCRERLHAMGARGVKRRTRSKTVANPAGLTTRELQVLELLTQGLSNADIARKLVRSEKTVDHHVSAALDKLAVRSRSEAAPRPRIAWGSPGRADCSRLPPMNASRSTSSMAEIEKLLGRHASLRSRRGPCRGVRQCRSRCWLRTR